MTDEEQRLRDAVVEASLEWLGNFTPTEPHEQCIADLRDYLAKASAPEPESRWSVGDKVMIEGTITHIAGKWFAVKMFNSDQLSSLTINFQEKHLHSPASPDERVDITDGREQPTRQAIAEWYCSRTVYESPVDLIMKALEHFGMAGRKA